MALILKARFGHDLDEVRQALDAVEVGLGKLVGEVGSKKLGPLIAEVQGFLPYDPTHRGWPPTDMGEPDPLDPGHIRDSVTGSSDSSRFNIITTHPGGPVHWWGGTIRPRGVPITIRKEAGAGEDFTSKVEEDVARDVTQALDDLLRRKNF